MKHYRFIMDTLKSESKGKDPYAAAILKQVISDVEKVWDKASLPRNHNITVNNNK